jgi:hypothetical protein
MAGKKRRFLKRLREGDPRKPRSLQTLVPDAVTPSGRRRADRRDWLSNMQAGHPEKKPPGTL